MDEDIVDVQFADVEDEVGEDCIRHTALEVGAGPLATLVHW